MSYEPTNWKSGDVVTSAKLNKLEQGVAEAGGGGVLIVPSTVNMQNQTVTLGKTWQEIHDADYAVIKTHVEVGDNVRNITSPVLITYNDSTSSKYYVEALGDFGVLEAASANDYPVSMPAQ